MTDFLAIAAARSAERMREALTLSPHGGWIAIKDRHPPLNRQVLVAQRDGVGGSGIVCDVACFIGEQPDGELRWILADIRIESRQLTHWAEIVSPSETAVTARAALEGE